MSESRMDRLERALARFESASDRRFVRLESALNRLTVQVTSFVGSQKELNAAITAGLKAHDRRFDHLNQTVDRLARTVDRFLRARANGRNGR